MDKHCVSLELAKQLKEAGWEKKIKFWYINENIKEEFFISEDVNSEVFCPYMKGVCFNLKCSECKLYSKLSSEVYPAPLATEILEELPETLKGNNLSITKSGGDYRIMYLDEEHCFMECEVAETLPNALAKMWLYLRKEKIK